MLAEPLLHATFAVGESVSDHVPGSGKKARCRYNRSKAAIDRFDVAGIGEAWGNKMDYVRREIRVAAYPWRYGIACELVAGDSPHDRIPPYNMLHYGGREPYFAPKESGGTSQ